MTAVPTDPEVHSRIPAGDLSGVRSLVRSATLADGRSPLSEQVMLKLGAACDEAGSHVLLPDRSPSRTILGYAHLDPHGGQGPVAELVVHPDHRGQGLGSLLVRTLQRLAAPGSLGIWAHGDTRPARALADRNHLTPARLLHRWFRDLTLPLAAPVPPEGITLRTFRPGQDETAWVALNAQAFASHPEQGRLTEEDLRARMAEPWFDPDGFFLAEKTGSSGNPVLAGFHWTKIHRDLPGVPPGPWGEHRQGPIGEVYVIGVHPQFQGLGLGKVLTLAGLHWLRSRGPGLAMLYVDGDNHPAQAVYRNLDFHHGDTDVLFVATDPRSYESTDRDHRQVHEPLGDAACEDSRSGEPTGA